MAPGGGCSEHLLSAVQQLALLALNQEEVNLTSVAKEVLLVLGLEASVTTVPPPKNQELVTPPKKVTRDEYGALMYIIFVMVLFAAPMIALIVRYLWGERESSRMEAFYSRMMENKPPRMILYDYNGRRLTKPELQRPYPSRKLTYHGIPYHEGYYNPASYCYRTTPLPTDEPTAVHSGCAGGKPPTIYLSEPKWRRWFASLSTPSSPDYPVSKYSFTQTISPGSPDSYLTPSTPYSASTFSVPFHLNPIALWRSRSGSDTSDTQPSLRLLSRIKSFRRENSITPMTGKEQNLLKEPEKIHSPKMICHENQSTVEKIEPKELPNVVVPHRKRAIIPGSAYRQLEEPSRLLESDIDACHSSSSELCRERRTSSVLPALCDGKEIPETNISVTRLSLPAISLQKPSRSQLLNDPTSTAAGLQGVPYSAHGRRTRKASDL